MHAAVTVRIYVNCDPRVWDLGNKTLSEIGSHLNSVEEEYEDGKCRQVYTLLLSGWRWRPEDVADMFRATLVNSSKRGCNYWLCRIIQLKNINVVNFPLKRRTHGKEETIYGCWPGSSRFLLALCRRCYRELASWIYLFFNPTSFLDHAHHQGRKSGQLEFCPHLEI